MLETMNSEFLAGLFSNSWGILAILVFSGILPEIQAFFSGISQAFAWNVGKKMPEMPDFFTVWSRRMPVQADKTKPKNKQWAIEPRWKLAEPFKPANDFTVDR